MADDELSGDELSRRYCSGHPTNEGSGVTDDRLQRFARPGGTVSLLNIGPPRPFRGGSILTPLIREQWFNF